LISHIVDYNLLVFLVCFTLINNANYAYCMPYAHIFDLYLYFLPFELFCILYQNLQLTNNNKQYFLPFELFCILYQNLQLTNNNKQSIVIGLVICDKNINRQSHNTPSNWGIHINYHVHQLLIAQLQIEFVSHQLIHAD